MSAEVQPSVPCIVFLAIDVSRFATQQIGERPGGLNSAVRSPTPEAASDSRRYSAFFHHERRRSTLAALQRRALRLTSPVRSVLTTWKHVRLTY